MKRPAPVQPRVPVSTRLAVVSLKALCVAFVVTTPVLGVWVASSLAAYQNGPTGVAVAAGALLFPGLPLSWEGWSSYRRARKGGAARPRLLTLGDRFILRTLVVNLLFLGALLAKSPTAAFSALSTRGDWMLDGRRGEGVDGLRRGLFLAADRLEWLYAAAHDNPYRRVDDPKDDPTPRPSADPTARADVPVPAPDPTPRPARASEWPAAGELHRTVKDIPPSSEESIQAVARYITERESDPFLRVKALHDYVADRVAYDAVALQPGRRPPQDAQTVFRTRKGVCEGYARLFTALANAAGVDAPYVGGDARTQGQRERGEPHAWNAVRVAGRFYLVDVTWDAGALDGETFTRRYRSDYLFTPPEVFGLDHYPDETRWQLRDAPVSRGDFMRQASLAPRFFAQGRKLLAPTRSQVSVDGSLDVRLGNPEGYFTLADFVAAEERHSAGSKHTNCTVTSGAETVVHCDFPTPGSWVVRLFGNREAQGSYAYLGQIEANSVR